MNWALSIEYYSMVVLLACTSLLSVVALAHCALQRPDSFTMAGPLSKGVWLAILAGTLLLTALGFGGGGLGIFGIIGLIAALVYLLDIRPSIRDGGSNPW